MTNETPPSGSPDGDHRVASDIPFYIALGILSGVYVVLIIGMLFAEVLYLFPPSRISLIVPEGTTNIPTSPTSLADPKLKVGLGDPNESEFGSRTSDFLKLTWAYDAVMDADRKHPIHYCKDPLELVDLVGLGQLDAALAPSDSSVRRGLVLLVHKKNPKRIQRLEDVARENVRVGLVWSPRFSSGKRTREALEVAGLKQKLTQRLATYNDLGPMNLVAQGFGPQALGRLGIVVGVMQSDVFKISQVQTVNQWESLPQQVHDGKIDVAIVPALAIPDESEGGTKLDIEIVQAAKKELLDVSRYPDHLSSSWYFLWWVRIKVWALVAPLMEPEIQYSLKLSLISCTLTTIISLWVAVPFGYAMSRYKFPGKGVVDAILDIPIVLPPLVIGLALLILFGTPALQWVESNTIPITFAVPSVIIAQFSVACAFAVRTMRVTFDQISPRQEQVALTLGCTQGQAFWYVVFPEARRGLITAATLAWARSLGEFGPILVFSGATRMRTEVLPTTVFLELSVGNIATAVSVSLLMIIAALIVLVIVRVFGTSPAFTAGK
ncbi:MAG: ABC transporter permease subunit [Gemmataceae bacterium]